ncbi:hypothetical protein HY991_06190 [Candidatus Micrarchaeota archaeon]|nr:hypothetical protein [Candidatus Micrarchaeota archaeon]
MVKKRGQAALYDGIMFLLLTGLSTSVVFVFISSYGNAQEQALRNAHFLNYLESVMKAMYYVDASNIAHASDSMPPQEQALYPNLNCRNLGNWGMVSVAELLKKDLADPGSSTSDVKLDGKFGNDALAPGKNAMRCAMKEIMKPFSYSGYKYLVEVVDPACTGPSCTAGAIYTAGEKITNSQIPNNGGALFSCDDVLSHLGESKKLMAVSTPFRILWVDNADANKPTKIRNYLLRICVWPTTE